MVSGWQPFFSPVILALAHTSHGITCDVASLGKTGRDDRATYVFEKAQKAEVFSAAKTLDPPEFTERGRLNGEQCFPRTHGPQPPMIQEMGKALPLPDGV